MLLFIRVDVDQEKNIYRYSLLDRTQLYSYTCTRNNVSINVSPNWIRVQTKYLHSS